MIFMRKLLWTQQNLLSGKEVVKMKEQAYLNELMDRYPILQPVRESIAEAYKVLRECFESGHKLLVAGNGGSAADSEHIVGELMKSFLLRITKSIVLLINNGSHIFLYGLGINLFLNRFKIFIITQSPFIPYLLSLYHNHFKTVQG